MRTLVMVLALASLGTSARAQSSFEAAASTFERAWVSGDADTIGRLMAPEGIRLQLGSESHSLVAVRQARAAVAEFRGSRADGRVEVQQSRGEPPKGSVQYRWQTVVQGTTEAVAYTIFVELTQMQSGWRISAIRVF
jgi:hypothetical protein